MARKKPEKFDDFPLKNYETTKFNLTIDDDTEEDGLVLFKKREGHEERRDYYMWFMYLLSFLGWCNNFY